jgi:carbonic anhydrase
VNPICASGTQQSPIDITRYDTQLSSDINIDLGTYTDYAALNIYDKGYTVQADFPGPMGNDGTFVRTFYGGEKAEFQAVQMHLHAPSEHTIDGYHFDAELHIVHLYKNGTLGGVLGMLFDRQ